MRPANLLVVAFFLAAFATNACAIDTTPGRFDGYVLSLSWEPAFCRAHADRNECSNQTQDRYDATHFILHGFWPDVDGDSRHEYAYCDVDSEDRDLDRASQWDQLPEPKLADATREAMRKYMPGFESHLHRHEWTRHGSCSGLDPDAYFATATAFVANVGATGFGRWISANAGKGFRRAELVAAFEREFGADAGRAILLVCDAETQSSLSEIRIGVRKPAPTDGELRGAIVPRRLGATRCATSIELDAVPQ